MLSLTDDLQSARRTRSKLGRLFASLSGLGLLVMGMGCGAAPDPSVLPVFPAEGKVLFKGSAPSGATIVLHPKSGAAKGVNAELVCPRGQVQPDGTFALTSYGADDGAPLGQYAVTLEWHKVVKSAHGEPEMGPNLLPSQYSRPQTSPLSANIVAGRNDLPSIVLK